MYGKLRRLGREIKMRIQSQNIADSLRWVNPLTNAEVKLGARMAENLVINPEYRGLLSSLLPFDNMSFEKCIGAGIQSKIYLLRFEDKKFALKKYNPHGSCSGITQFSCLRKIKMLGYNTPEVYVATPDILLMDYIPNQTIEDYVNKNPNEKRIISNLWEFQMGKISKIIPEEVIDELEGNGYIIQDLQDIKLGIFDQG